MAQPRPAGLRAAQVTRVLPLAARAPVAHASTQKNRSKAHKTKASKKAIAVPKPKPELFELHYLIDRMQIGGSVHFLVLWQSIRGRCARTWEPATELLKDDPTLQVEMDLVNRWYASGRLVNFATYMADDDVGIALLAANDDETCCFVAVRKAAELLGRPEMYSEAEYEAFVRDSVHHAIDASEGLTPAALVAFVRRLYINGAPIDMELFDYNQVRTGHLHRDAIFRLELKDGFYIVGAQKLSRVGHAFTLEVTDGVHIVHDDRLVIPLEEYGAWITRVRFVRKFAIGID